MPEDLNSGHDQPTTRSLFREPQQTVPVGTDWTIFDLIMVARHIKCSMHIKLHLQPEVHLLMQFNFFVWNKKAVMMKVGIEVFLWIRVIIQLLPIKNTLSLQAFPPEG